MKFLFTYLNAVFFLSIVFLFFSCGNSNQNKFQNGFPDANYRAAVEYFNPKTKTTSDYSLYVEVKNKKVYLIHFDNGGWLDETHIVSGGELNPDGKTTIFTDRGYEYRISLND